MKSRTRSRKFGAVFFIVVVAAAVGVVLLVDPLGSGGSQDLDVSDITSYEVTMTLGDDGVLEADEQITVNFPVARRGIFRIFDTADPRRDIDHAIEGLTVTRDGQPEPWVWQDSARGTATARIGVEDVWLPPGEYTYGLKWRTKDVLEPSVINGEEDPDTTLWWWDVIGSGWPMPIGATDITVNLPAEPTRTECVIGESTPCEPTVDGRTMTLQTGALAPFEPVTVRVGMPSDIVPPNQAPSELIWLALLTGLTGLGLGLLGIRATRETAPGFPVLYEPPAGIRPAVGVRVLDEKASGEELQATLFDLGDRGLVRISPEGEKWRIDMVGDVTQTACEDWEVKMLSKLSLRSVGDSFTVSKTVKAGKKIAKAKESLEGGATVAVDPYLQRSGVGSLVAVLGWLSGAGLVAMAGFHFFGGFEFPLWLITGLAGFAVPAAFVATDVGASTVRTEAGRDVWSRTGGFARFLSTDSSDSRFDAAAHLDWFPKYLPWAVALGVGDEWAKRYEAQGVDPPEVPYLYGWGYGMGYSRGFSDFNSSFAGAITSASAAYAASQAASSASSGGGFSGGSGGGGGGGGSW